MDALLLNLSLEQIRAAIPVLHEKALTFLQNGDPGSAIPLLLTRNKMIHRKNVLEGNNPCGEGCTDTRSVTMTVTEHWAVRYVKQLHPNMTIAQMWTNMEGFLREEWNKKGESEILPSTPTARPISIVAHIHYQGEERKEMSVPPLNVWWHVEDQHQDDPEGTWHKVWCESMGDTVCEAWIKRVKNVDPHYPKWTHFVTQYAAGTPSHLPLSGY